MDGSWGMESEDTDSINDSRYDGLRASEWVQSDPDSDAGKTIGRSTIWIRIIGVVFIVIGIGSASFYSIIYYVLSKSLSEDPTFSSVANTNEFDYSAVLLFAILVSLLFFIVGCLLLVFSKRIFKKYDVSDAVVINADRLAASCNAGSLRYHWPTYSSDTDGDSHRNDYYIDSLVFDSVDERRWHFVYADRRNLNVNGKTSIPTMRLKSNPLFNDGNPIGSIMKRTIDSLVGSLVIVIVETHGSQARLLVPTDAYITDDMMKQLGFTESDANIDYQNGVALFKDIVSLSE